jgi:hypothetical protein
VNTASQNHDDADRYMAVPGLYHGETRLVVLIVAARARLSRGRPERRRASHPKSHQCEGQDSNLHVQLIVDINALSASRLKRHNQLVPRNSALILSPMGLGSLCGA